MKKPLTRKGLDDVSNRALKGLSGSSSNRLAICELIEYIEAVMDSVGDVRFKSQPIHGAQSNPCGIDEHY